MSKLDTLDELIDSNRGYLLTALVQDAGISRTYLSKYVKENNLERVDSGIYISPNIFPDPLYILQLRNKEIIFCNETALYLHGLLEREPERINVSVKQGYNATHLINKGIKPYYIKKELFDQGVSVVKTIYGNEVRVYDIDRTICDIVQRKDNMDIQDFQFAIKEYMSGNKKNPHRLMLYAKQLKLESRIRIYTEVLL